MAGAYKRLVRSFAKFGKRYFGNYLHPIKQEIEQSNLSMVYETYIGKMFFYTIFSSIGIFLYMFFLLTFVASTRIPIAFIGSLLFGLISFFVILSIFHAYPFQKINSKKLSIEANLPFAINHMAAISGGGVPPYIMFKLMQDIEEYGEISTEAKVITRNIEAFGMDLLQSIRQVAERTPSEDFKQLLLGIVSITKTGGSLEQFLKNTAKESLFDYKLKRDKYLNTLSTYADIYTAVLIAAPLFFVSILSVMSMIGGNIAGMTIPEAMRVGIYAIIPFLNMMFLMFLHFTQPPV
jgi:flagellar protein FlaJ